MKSLNKLKDFFIVLISSGMTFFLIEFCYRSFNNDNKEKKIEGFTNRIMLFESGKNFKNYKDYFKYHPNISIRSLTLHSKQNPQTISDLKVSYDYFIKTNNAGLVMLNNLNKADKALFIIGDSFTEGQGATPWFYKMEKNQDITNLKLINLGLLGTGPEQWINLSNAIKKEFRPEVKGAVINIIPEDMNRTTRNFHKRELDCLKYIKCDYSLGFQGFNFSEKLTYEDIKNSVLYSLNNEKKEDISIFTALKLFIKNSRIISDIYYQISSSPREEKVQRNEIALLALKTNYEDNIFINVVSQKTINSNNYLNYDLAKNLIKFLKENDFNYQWCDIPLRGFHIYDNHPNEEGYKYLKKCTENAIIKISK